MQPGSKNPMTKWEAETRRKIEDLKSSLAIVNVEWNEWERGFITDISQHLEDFKLNVTPKQNQIIWDLWEKL